LQRSSQINSHGLCGCCRRGDGTDGTILFKEWTSQGRSSKVSRWPLCPPWGTGDCGSATAALLSTLTISYDFLPLTYQRGCRLAGEACWAHIKRTWRISKLTCRPFLWHLGLAILSCPTPAAFHAWTTQLLSGRIHLDEVFEPASWS